MKYDPNDETRGWSARETRNCVLVGDRWNPQVAWDGCLPGLYHRYTPEPEQNLKAWYLTEPKSLLWFGRYTRLTDMRTCVHFIQCVQRGHENKIFESFITSCSPGLCTSPSKLLVFVGELKQQHGFSTFTSGLENTSFVPPSWLLRDFP